MAPTLFVEIINIMLNLIAIYVSTIIFRYIKLNYAFERLIYQCVEMKMKTKPEAMLRMDFLYRAAHLVNGIPYKQKELDSQTLSSTKNNAKRIVSTHLSQLMVGIGRKAVQRASVEVKRTICKGCRNILLPGRNAKCVYMKSSNKSKEFHIICHQCKTRKKFPLQKRLPKNRN